MGLWQHRLAQVVSAMCVCTFLTSFFFHLFICTPVHKSWQVKPYAGGKNFFFFSLFAAKEKLIARLDNCTVRPLNYIVIETLSIVYIPLPINHSSHNKRLTCNPISQHRHRHHDRTHPPRPHGANPPLPETHALRPLLLRYLRHGRRLPPRLLLREKHLHPLHCARMGVARSPGLGYHRQRAGD